MPTLVVSARFHDFDVATPKVTANVDSQVTTFTVDEGVVTRK